MQSDNLSNKRKKKNTLSKYLLNVCLNISDAEALENELVLPVLSSLRKDL